jgi:hypothetical protein
VSPSPPELAGLEIAMDVRAYRERPGGRHAPKSTAQALWNFLRGAEGSATLPKG